MASGTGFADDTKIFSQVSNPEDYINLQKDLNRLVTWAEEWQMLFNVGKCKVMPSQKVKSPIDANSCL